MPPRLAHRFFKWYCHPRLRDYIEGDLMEVYERRVRQSGKREADIKFIIDVLLLFRPGIIRPAEGHQHLNTYGMYKSFFKIGWRNLVRGKGYSLINIGGLALGIAITMLIGLWVNNELSFDKGQGNYDRMAAVMQNNEVDGDIETWSSQSYQLGPELRNHYGNYFKYVVMSSFPASSILSIPDKVLSATGTFMEEDGPEVLSLHMIHGTRAAFKDRSAIFLSASLARRLYGEDDPMGKILKLDNGMYLKVAGVYQDLYDRSSFRGEMDFIAALDIIVSRGGRNFGWVNNWLQVFVELEENVDLAQASLAIKDAKIRNVNENDKRFHPQLFLFPLSKWHLYSEFNHGVNTGGHIEFVRLFGAIGAFVLLLACINFMNLSTARSQKRSKEVGVRKAIGSGRGQLVRQFLVESLLVVMIAFLLAIALAYMALPWFNEIADRNIIIEWQNPFMWLLMVAVILIISLLAGSYPSLYLSDFRPVEVLKGTFKLGRMASLPRKVLVIVQFTVSVTLIISTVVVYRQVEYAKNRPLGYQLKGLITIPMKTPEVKSNYEALRNDLLASGVIREVSKSETTVTNLWPSDWGFQWKGKDPEMQDNIYRGAVDYGFGKTVGWKIVQGRDFSRDFPSDSSAMILNEAAVKYMGLKDPIGETIRGYGRNYTVIGVVKDMVTQSLYEPNKQTVFVLDPFNQAHYIDVRYDPQVGTSNVLEILNQSFEKINPNTPFEYTFADDEFSNKFEFEARIGRLVGIFATLAIFISCLGLFGLSSFVAEQRTKEIGIRKVMGASVAGLWQLLSHDFVMLVLVSSAIAIPVAWYYLHQWLQGYTYHTEISWWIFLASSLGALGITLLTVSFQAVKAALMNPVNSLRSE